MKIGDLSELEIVKTAKDSEVKLTLKEIEEEAFKIVADGGKVDNKPAEIVIPKTDIMIINPNDPYDTPSERAELNDILYTKLFGWTGNFGTFSTWRERHIFLRGFRNGFGTKLLGQFTEVPAMWSDEGQYYEAGQELGYVVKIFVQIAAVFVATQLGVVGAVGGFEGTTLPVDSILSAIGKLAGIFI